MKKVNKETNKNLKLIAAQAISNFLFWAQSENKEKAELAEKNMVMVFDEIKARKL